MDAECQFRSEASMKTAGRQFPGGETRVHCYRFLETGLFEEIGLAK